MAHNKKLSQICKAWCAQCGENVTTTVYDGVAEPFLTPGIDWSSSPDGLESLLRYHHAAVFTIIVNSHEVRHA